MATRIFRIDLSEGARDFKPVATEPGLPMLDRASANNTILHRWLGNMVTEPVWIGDDSINVFVVGDKGRLDKIDIQPATKADLEGPLAADLKTLQARIKKAKPESATEQSLHRVVRQTVAQLANDLEAGGQDSFFFKYRKGKDPWKLVWSWGYQRTDLEPAAAAICTNPECHQLFVKRPQNKNKCPNCDETPSAKRGGSGGGGVFASRGVQIGGLAAAALFALLLLFFFGSRTQLVVTPAEIAGPAGSRIDYKVMSRRFFVFNNNVTSQVLPQSHDAKIIEFAPDKGYALARKPGTTLVKFQQGSSEVKADIKITSPATPKSLVIEPKSLRLGVGEFKELKATGYYEGDVKIDLTDFADWEVEDGKVGYASSGRVEGFERGKTNVIAKYRGVASDKYTEAKIPLEVAPAPGTLTISPSSVSLAIDESTSLDIVSADQDTKIDLESSDPTIVEVLPGHKLIGRGKGTAEIIVKQGEKQQTVRARVKETPYKSLHVVPSTITVKTGEPATFKVFGRTADGKQTEISAEKLLWLKQPLAENANVDRDKLGVFGLRPTEKPQELVVQLGDDLTALAKVEVVKGAKPLTEIDRAFQPYPPIPVGGGTITVDPGILGKGLVYSDDGGIVVREIDAGSPLGTLGIPKGAIITGLDDGTRKIGFEGMGASAVREYLLKNKIRKGHRIQYRDPKTRELKVVTLNDLPAVGAITDVALQSVKTVDATAADFRAELTFDFREKAEYRLVDAGEKPLSDWQPLGPNASAKILSNKIPRVPGDDYDIWVRRKIGDTVRKFQFSFKLAVENK